MRLATKIIVGAAVIAAAVAAASFGASAPAAASETLQAARTDAVTDMSARKRPAKRHQGTSLRVTKLSPRASEPPNPNRTYYRPVPSFYPFAQNRGYF
jgi:hypothetical protein